MQQAVPELNNVEGKPIANKPENVRSLARGLQILRYLNISGGARVLEIAKALVLPRPTVYRLLHTLEEEGYVLFSATDARARVTPLTATLGENALGRSQLCQVAGPIMTEFTKCHSWPVDLSIYNDLHMIVQETTHGRSPLSIDTGMAGFLLPMLRSSAGRAYLAYCSDNQKNIILDLLSREGHPKDKYFLLPRWRRETLTVYTSQGFATRGPNTFRPKTSSIAVPICTCDNTILGCLSIIWITKAMTMDEAAQQYSKLLTQAASEIAAKLESG